MQIISYFDYFFSLSSLQMSVLQYIYYIAWILLHPIHVIKRVYYFPIFISLYYICLVSCGGLTMASSHTSTCSLPLQWNRGDNQKSKKTGGWIKRCFIKWRKTNKTQHLNQRAMYRQSLTASYTQIDIQPVTNQDLLSKIKLPVFIVEYDVMWYGISLQPVWVGCSGFVPSQDLSHFQWTHCRLGEDWRTAKECAERKFENHLFWYRKI